MSMESGKMQVSQGPDTTVIVAMSDDERDLVIRVAEYIADNFDGPGYIDHTALFMGDKGGKQEIVDLVTKFRTGEQALSKAEYITLGRVVRYANNFLEDQFDPEVDEISAMSSALKPEFV